MDVVLDNIRLVHMNSRLTTLFKEENVRRTATEFAKKDDMVEAAEQLDVA